MEKRKYSATMTASELWTLEKELDTKASRKEIDANGIVVQNWGETVLYAPNPTFHIIAEVDGDIKNDDYLKGKGFKEIRF